MTPEEIRTLADAEIGGMTEVRRHLHMYPELSFKEEKTSAHICAMLERLGIPFTAGVGGGFGIVARIDSGRPGANIAFRADFDALAMDEENTVEYRSRVPGVMHACGHDFHTAVLLGLGGALAKDTSRFSGSVTLIFQPAEELPPGGAASMVEAGCMAGVDRIFAMHVDPELETGAIGVCPGPYMAASAVFSFTLTGSGGHGSRPQDADDVLSAACDSVGMINTIVSRRVPADEPVVISVCTLHAGAAYNILPARASFSGTVRTFSGPRENMARAALERAVAGVCASYGVSYEYRFDAGYPVVVNDPACTELVRRAVSSLGHIRLVASAPTAVAEDFSHYLAKAPGCFFRVGIRNEALGAVMPLHHSRFLLDEAGMSTGLQALLAILENARA